MTDWETWIQEVARNYPATPASMDGHAFTDLIMKVMDGVGVHTVDRATVLKFVQEELEAITIPEAEDEAA